MTQTLGSLIGAGRRMMRCLPAAASLLVALAAASPALACRVAWTPQDVVRGSYDAIVVVKVANVRNDTVKPDDPLWEAVGRVTTIVQGEPSARRVVFGAYEVRTSCDTMDREMARSGEHWVLYLRNMPQPDGAKQQGVARAYRLSTMLEADPRVASALPPPPELPRDR